MKISVGTPQLWKIYAESSQQDSVKDVVLFSLFFYFFNDSWLLAVPSLTPQMPKWGKGRGGRKRGGSRLGMVFQRDVSKYKMGMDI